MITFLWSLLFFILALGVLVAVHEWGHFWVARKCGVKVERFSIGFGKALWKRTDKLGTEFVVAAIPLGGYVKMLDERVDEVEETDLPYAFNRQSVQKRIAIIAAGPLTNFIFAIFALMLMYMIGVETVRPVVGEVQPQSIAQTGGLTPGMEIKGVGDNTTADWKAVNLELISHIGDEELKLSVTMPESNVVLQKTLDIRNWKFDPESESALTSLGIEVFRPDITNELAFIAEDSAAEQANLLVGDEILSLDGTLALNWEQIVGYIAARPNQNIEIVVLREGRQVQLSVIVGQRETNDGVRGYLGVVPKAEPWPDSHRIVQEFGPLAAIVKGGEDTWRLTTLSLQMIGKLLVGDVSVKNLSGPISIAKGAGISASYGVVYFLSFLALISVNLGVINLLPLPVLDGGHLLYYVVEFVTGRPVPDAVQEVGFKIGGALLMLLMTVAIFNDIARL